MITDRIAFEKRKLGKKIGETFQEVESLLKQLPPHKTMYIINDCHAFNVFWAEHADLTKISLEETQERFQQVMNLLERIKNL
ncbi:hypothetical protein [Bacillus cereus]|uniref:hypothetical protein n=1 Tax=Bacillus cereus TaxID=1396 RepID=UPI003CFA6A76